MPVQNSKTKQTHFWFLKRRYAFTLILFRLSRKMLINE